MGTLLWILVYGFSTGLLACASHSRNPQEQAMAKSIRIAIKTDRTQRAKTIAGILARQVRSRSGVPVRIAGRGDLTVVLEIQPGIGKEGFRIEDGPDGAIHIIGNDERGLLYGAGKFLRTSCYEIGSFSPGAWRGTSVPQKEVRGIYFATHFHNFYHDAPVREIERYVEDLALWGYNALTVWFDMHHYQSIADPKARKMIRRLHAILSAAKKVGMDVGLVVIANEAYANSPMKLRAEPTNRAHFGIELCPYKPGAEELTLKWLEEEFKAFSDIGLDSLWIWPYDQGGCSCKQCAPWGANGFLKMAEPISRLFRRYFPKARIVLSTWLFDFQRNEGEWEGLAKAFQKRPEWASYILADGHDAFPEYPLKNGVPGGLPLLNFPEISMWNSWPYGGFGANPFPARLQSLWDRVSSHISGGYPYSEGIYEDINKVIISQFYWDPSRKAAGTLREYIAYECSPEVIEDVLRAIEILEKNLYHVWILNPQGELQRHERKEDYGASEAYECLKRSEKRLSSFTKTGWRWRILFLRALIDKELKQNNGLPTDACEAAFQELTRIYHARKAEYYVSPPTREAIKAGRTSVKP